MTTDEQKLIDYFRSFDEAHRNALMATASYLAAYPATSAPDPATVQTSNLPVYLVQRTNCDPELMKYQKTRSIINIAKRADGNVPLRYSLTISDIAVLSDLLYEDRTGIKPFGVAFDFGFVMGSRATRRGKVKAL